MNTNESTNKPKERPILFSAPMVRAILDGRKSQTRRVVKPQPTSAVPCGGVDDRVFAWGLDFDNLGWQDAERRLLDKCPYGVVGGRLWVRETFFDHGPLNGDENIPLDARVEYRATEWERKDPSAASGWMSPIHMPRWASRITLEITDVRVERLQDLSQADAIAEGCPSGPILGTLSREAMRIAVATRTNWFHEGWNKLNAKRGYSWESNPWVWVLSFRRET